MLKGQREEPAHVLPVGLEGQGLGEEQPGHGVPVVPGEKQLPLRHVHHGGARGVPGAGDHLGGEAAQVHRPGVHQSHRRHGHAKKGLPVNGGPSSRRVVEHLFPAG